LTATPKHNAVLICGPWPHPRNSIFEVVSSLIASLHRLGWPVSFLCGGFGLVEQLGAEAICLMNFPPDEPFDWRGAFCRKRIYSSLSAFVAEDQRRTPSLLERVGIIHVHSDQLIFHSNHRENSKQFERVLADYIARRTGQRPRVVRSRHDDMEGNLTGFMRLTGIDYMALNRAEREKILRSEVDLWSVVAEHVSRNRDQLRLWGYGDAHLNSAGHHVWWLVHQLSRWRYELNHFDAVVCLTSKDVEATRDLLACEKTRNLISIHPAASFQPTTQERIDQLLYGYHHQKRLICHRGAEEHRQPIPFAPTDQKVVFVGRPTRMKGCFELVESLKILYHSGRRNIRGILIGAFGLDLRRELAAIDPDHANEYLLFPGPIHDVDILASLYAFGDVTAVPSHYDSFPLVGLESYRMGTPCVVTEGTGAGEAYVDNPRRHGVEMALPVRRQHKEGIARYHGVDVGSLTEQIAFLLDHLRVAGRMAEDGRCFVSKHYSVERMAARYAELYDLLIQGEEAARLSD
jgi:glycosyltransferase involved in cell wall biosynthesis